MGFLYECEDGRVELTDLQTLRDVETITQGTPKEGTKCSCRIVNSNFSTGHNHTDGEFSFSESKYCTLIKESESDCITVVVGLTSVSDFDRLVDVCLSRLHVGETGDFQVNCSRSKVSCRLTLQLVSIQESVELYTLKSDTINEISNSLKEQGVELFSKGFTIDAFYKFSKAAKYLGLLHPSNWDPNQTSAISTLRSNMASCHVKVGNWRDAIDLCSLVLQQDPDNVKALYRRGLSYIEIQEYEKANDDLQKAKQIDPENQAVRKKLAVIDEKTKALNAKYAQAMKKFLS